MREILFRGKRVDNGEWVEGATLTVLYQENTALTFMPQAGEPVKADAMDSNDRILTSIYGNFYQVIPATVGQYTGLTDKNGKMIFEGDIVSIYTPCNEKHNIGVISFGYYASGIPAIFKTNLGFYIEWASEDNINRIDFGFWIQAYQDETEVIGNIHDNPELLEVKE